jgi:cyclopropane-fatty-acyl-phospholipid synthase
MVPCTMQHHGIRMDAIAPKQRQGRLPPAFAPCWARVRRTRVGRLDIVLPDGARFRHEGAEPGPQAEIEVRDPRLFARILRDGDLGFAESYLDGMWTSPNLQALQDLLHAGAGVLAGDPAGRRGGLLAWLRGRLGAAGRARARRDVAAHYDLGNEFYGLWLDRTMTYSSALFRTGEEDLETAQRAKYDAILDRLGLSEGAHVLEIGCGWGGFALHAARRGLRVTGLTISPAQAQLARARVCAAGLGERVRIRLTDYRDAEGRYDGVACIEMLEAVGRRGLARFFAVLRERLRPGGRAALQVIEVPDARWPAYARGEDFVQRHIFPGGFLPSPARLDAKAARAGLVSAGRDASLRESYSLTLRRWHARFDARWPEAEAMGHDARFRRRWELYLTGCAAAFAHGLIDVRQLTLGRPA